MHRFKLALSLLLFTLIAILNNCNKDEIIPDNKNSINPSSPNIPNLKSIPNTVTDIDGNVYHTILIGEQLWLVENLKTTHYRNGDEILNLCFDDDWKATKYGAYCTYGNYDPCKNTYGLLYNWYAVNDSRNIAPDGWHVATNDDWQTLVSYLGDTWCAGGKMKESGTVHWKSPNLYATNISGFTSLPGGWRYWQGRFNTIYAVGQYWSNSEYDITNAWSYINGNSSNTTDPMAMHKNYGFSVRCVWNNRPEIAVLETINFSNISSTSVICGGNITSDGGAPISMRGVCWNTTSFPTILDNKTNDGTSIGIYNSQITGLVPNTTYFVRAYAINENGVAYGNEISFTTIKDIPTISTTAITSITNTGAISGGNITSDGGSTIINRGVCWNTSHNPTISNNKTINGSGTGNYTSELTDLNPNTTYYVRAWATNSLGTSYGDEIYFTTSNWQTFTPSYSALVQGTNAWYVFNVLGFPNSGSGTITYTMTGGSKYRVTYTVTVGNGQYGGGYGTNRSSGTIWTSGNFVFNAGGSSGYSVTLNNLKFERSPN